jgi:hypothetical protein
VNGTAQLVRDEWLRERMIVQGKLPILSLVVTVEEVFFHCTKCVVRSGLWDDTQWPDHDGLSSLAKVVVDQSKLDLDVEWLETDLREDEKSGLY